MVFNFDNLIFLVISIGSWVFVLIRCMTILRGKKKSKRRFSLIPLPPLFPIHSYLFLFVFGSRGYMSCKFISLIELTSPRTLHLTGITTTQMSLKCRCSLWAEINSISKDWLEHLVLRVSTLLGGDQGVHFQFSVSKSQGFQSFLFTE